MIIVITTYITVVVVVAIIVDGANNSNGDHVGSDDSGHGDDHCGGGCGNGDGYGVLMSVKFLRYLIIYRKRENISYENDHLM